MTEDIHRLASELADETDSADRRETAAQLQEAALRRRTTLAKRGRFSESATSPLDDERLDVLNSAIDDPDTEVRRLATKSAGDLGDERSIEALIARLQEHDIKIRLAAIISLGEIGGPRSVRALGGVVRSDDQPQQLRMAALTELEELAAKPITSGPDRHFDPPQAAEQERGQEAAGVKRTKEALLDTLADVESTDEEEAIMRLKAADIRRYLEGGAYD